MMHLLVHPNFDDITLPVPFVKKEKNVVMDRNGPMMVKVGLKSKYVFLGIAVS